MISNTSLLEAVSGIFCFHMAFKYFQDSSRKKSLSLSNVAGVFYILISGLVVAVIFGAVSFIVLKVRLIPVVRHILMYLHVRSEIQ